MNDSLPIVRKFEEAPGILFFVELPRPIDPQHSTYSSSTGPIPTFDPDLEGSGARENTISLPPETEGADAIIDWDAEASRVALDVVKRIDEEKEFRPLDQHPAGMGPPPPKSSRHKLGDSQRFEGGEIITWVGPGCYYSNQNVPIAAFGQVLRLQLPVCTGAGGASGKPFPNIQEWKKERDNR